MLRDILTFNSQKASTTTLRVDCRGFTLGEYFNYRKFAPRLLTDYLAPMGAAIWSAPGLRDAGLPRRELRRIFQQPSPAAICLLRSFFALPLVTSKS
jgi:uncharacterized protein